MGPILIISQIVDGIAPLVCDSDSNAGGYFTKRGHSVEQMASKRNVTGCRQRCIKCSPSSKALTTTRPDIPDQTGDRIETVTGTARSCSLVAHRLFFAHYLWDMVAITIIINRKGHTGRNEVENVLGSSVHPGGWTVYPEKGLMSVRHRHRSILNRRRRTGYDWNFKSSDAIFYHCC